ncbi:MAG: hypothetical protein MUO58_04530 [Anaerolineales bacterium]|nr:hypothetical protein [Anaerolineales bacterium]
MLDILDTLPAFMTYWTKVRDLDIEQQIDLWASEYLSSWPDLLSVQIEDYRSQGVDWRTIARTRIFPQLDSRLRSMLTARDHLLEALPTVVEQVGSRYGALEELLCVIHVGLGCGAGWARTFRERPAVLFGLENIAECGWLSAESLRGLIAHELGHLLLDHWRRAAGLARGQEPLWQLFEEGFAQHIALESTGIWHQDLGSEASDWLNWCEANLTLLATRYLDFVHHGKPVNEFFGSWLEIDSRSQVGAYLGCKLIRRLAQEHSLLEIAALPEVDGICFAQLKMMAGGN